MSLQRASVKGSRGGFEQGPDVPRDRASPCVGVQVAFQGWWPGERGGSCAMVQAQIGAAWMATAGSVKPGPQTDF